MVAKESFFKKSQNKINKVKEFGRMVEWKELKKKKMDRGEVVLENVSTIQYESNQARMEWSLEKEPNYN